MCGEERVVGGEKGFFVSVWRYESERVSYSRGRAKKSGPHLIKSRSRNLPLDSLLTSLL